MRIAAAVKHMLAARMSAEAIVAAVADMEAADRPSRSSGAERQARYRERKALRVTSQASQASLTVTGDGGTSKEVPTPLRNTTPQVDTPSTPKGVSVPKLVYAQTEFDEFWMIVPRKVGKDGAVRAYLKARKRASKEAIHDGARRWAEVERGKDPTFCKHPAKWLNDGCWQDEPTTIFRPNGHSHGNRPHHAKADRRIDAMASVLGLSDERELSADDPGEPGAYGYAAERGGEHHGALRRIAGPRSEAGAWERRDEAPGRLSG